MALSHEAIARAGQAWPDLKISQAVFATYVEQRAHARGALDEEALAELFIACGCHLGDRIALSLFDTRYLNVVSVALAHMALSADQVDEVRQLVRHKLLVAEPGAESKLDGYAGRGKLRGLVQVVAVRAAISMIRKNKPHVKRSDDLAELPDNAHDDPELAYMKKTYRAAFKRAFQAALGSLTSRQRNVLRLHHFGGLTVEQVGKVYGVHRATATRWLAQIRASLMSATGERLGADLNIPPAELGSLMGLIRSRLDVSVQRLLESHSDEPDTQPPDLGATTRDVDAEHGALPANVPDI